MDNELLEYKVLYIEDEKEVNEKISSRMKRYFKSVYSTLNAEDGYKIYLEKSPQIIFVDINLPGMSGIEFIKKIRENDQNTKVVMLTARSDVEAILEATSLKLTKYIIKPLDRKQLEEVIELLTHELNSFQIRNKRNILFKENFLWDFRSDELFQNSKKVHLTPQEKKLFKVFIKNQNQILTYDSLVIILWDDFTQDKIDSIKAIIKKLRKKLPTGLIENEYSIGYKLLN